MSTTEARRVNANRLLTNRSRCGATRAILLRIPQIINAVPTLELTQQLIQPARRT